MYHSAAVLALSAVIRHPLMYSGQYYSSLSSIVSHGKHNNTHSSVSQHQEVAVSCRTEMVLSERAQKDAVIA